MPAGAYEPWQRGRAPCLTGRNCVRQQDAGIGGASERRFRMGREDRRVFFSVMKKNTAFYSKSIDSFGEVNIL